MFGNIFSAIIKRFAYRQMLLFIFIFRSDRFKYRIRTSSFTEQSVMHKNGFAKLATLCGVNLCVEKIQPERNIKEELSFFKYALK